MAQCHRAFFWQKKANLTAGSEYEHSLILRHAHVHFRGNRLQRSDHKGTGCGIIIAYLVPDLIATLRHFLIVTGFTRLDTGLVIHHADILLRNDQEVAKRCDKIWNEIRNNNK